MGKPKDVPCIEEASEGGATGIDPESGARAQTEGGIWGKKGSVKLPFREVTSVRRTC